MCYSVQPRDRIFVKGMDFLFLLKIWVKILVRIQVKTLVVNSARKITDQTGANGRKMLKYWCH